MLPNVSHSNLTSPPLRFPLPEQAEGDKLEAGKESPLPAAPVAVAADDAAGQASSQTAAAAAAVMGEVVEGRGIRIKYVHSALPAHFIRPCC